MSQNDHQYGPKALSEIPSTIILASQFSRLAAAQTIISQRIISFETG